MLRLKRRFGLGLVKMLQREKRSRAGPEAVIADFVVLSISGSLKRVRGCPMLKLI